jgi:hypothetical protein
MSLNSRAQAALKDMFNEIDSVNIDEIKLDGITIRAGSKLVRLEVVHEEVIEVEDEIREEYRIKLRGKLQEIKTRLTDKINDVMAMTSRVRAEAEAKERELNEKIRTIKAMPEITWDQAKAGVSIVQGERRDEICYLIRGIYYPQFVNERPLDPTYAKKLISPIIFFFKTVGDKITEFSTRKPQNLTYFPHYHQQNPDCWGEFKYDRRFKNINDLIKIKNDAEAVLQNVNTNSIASSNPRGLPRKATLLRHIVTNDDRREKQPGVKLTVDQRRRGVGDAIRVSDNDVWQV